MSSSSSSPADVRLYCVRCKGETKHEMVWESRRSEALFAQGDRDEDGPSVYGIDRYKLWQCLGCETPSLEHASGLDIDDGELRIEYYPQKNRNSICPKYFTKLPEKLQAIYKESLICWNADAWTLCAVGLRSLIEGICRDKGIRAKTLEEKIDGLNQLLPEGIVKNLHGLRFMGNQAVHEFEPPQGYELATAIEICEDLLNYLYELDYKTARLSHIAKEKDIEPE